MRVNIFLIVIINLILIHYFVVGQTLNTIEKTEKENSDNNRDELTDEDYIKNYKGGELEEEWNWVKNISIVYTWVDGSDANFLDLKSKYEYGYRKNNSRYRSADELKYSIRSVEKYMPWFNGTIYIVTCHQKPKWLDLEHPRVTLIDHKDIIPEYIYPTFDSNTIELFLDRIPGISERFIYFNDDVFLNNYIHPCFFFTRETFYPKVYRNENSLHLKDVKVNEYILENKYMFLCNAYFTREIIREYFDSDYTYYFIHHAPFVLYRDMYEPFRQLFKEDLKSRCAHRFRNHYKLQILYLLQVYTQYAPQHPDFPLKIGGDGKAKNFKGQPLPEHRSINHYSIEIIDGSISNKYILYHNVEDNSKTKGKVLKLSNPNSSKLVFNLNDKYYKKTTYYNLIEFLIEKFPFHSSFEKRKYVDLENKTRLKIDQVENFSKDMIERLPNSFDELKIRNFNDVVKENKYQIIGNYLKDINNTVFSDTDLQTSISDYEEEEMNVLLNYKGMEIENEWEWAKSISTVYLLEYNKNYTSYEVDILALKYSLRSLETYLPWLLGTIFIVINPLIFSHSGNNIPKELAWLNTNHPRIKIVNQNDILPQKLKSLPITNKNFIEMYLDKIPGISEKFIYLDNYHYFKDYTHPRYFFSGDYYPKYPFDSALSDSEENSIKENDFPFFNTYSIIKRYFGKFYIKKPRYLKDAPCPLYRDLFEPVRQLYTDYIDKEISNFKDDNEFHSFNILPLYLVSTYNVYGTDQPYYPDYVNGYGKVRKAKLPVLNNNRTVDYYGFDITSQYISENTTLSENIYSNVKINNYKIFYRIKYLKGIFFNIKIKDKNNFTLDTIIELFQFLNSFYNKKSSFEI